MELLVPTTVHLFPASIKPRTRLSPPIFTSKPFFRQGKRNNKLLPCGICGSSWTTRNHNGRNNESFSSDAEEVREPLGLERTHWVVVMEKPKSGVSSKWDAIDHFVGVLSKVLGSERDAQTCIYHVLWETDFGFCCCISEEESRMLAGLSGVLSIRHDGDVEPLNKGYSVDQRTLTCPPGFASSTDRDNQKNGSSQYLFGSDTKHWIVQMEKPGVAVVTKPQMVDYYAQTLSKVLGNEQDAQMCIYHLPE